MKSRTYLPNKYIHNMHLNIIIMSNINLTHIYFLWCLHVVFDCFGQEMFGFSFKCWDVMTFCIDLYDK